MVKWVGHEVDERGEKKIRERRKQMRRSKNKNKNKMMTYDNERWILYEEGREGGREGRADSTTRKEKV